MTRAIFELFNHGELNKYELAEIGNVRRTHIMMYLVVLRQLASCMGDLLMDFSKPGVPLFLAK